MDATIVVTLFKMILGTILTAIVEWLVINQMDKLNTKKLQKNTLHLLEDTIEKTINVDGSKVEKRTRKYKP